MSLSDTDTPRKSAEERIARLHSELNWIRARYDCNAVSDAVYQTIKEIEAAISWLQHEARPVDDNWQQLGDVAARVVQKLEEGVRRHPQTRQTSIWRRPPAHWQPKNMG
jgi:hypothetical protein